MREGGGHHGGGGGGGGTLPVWIRQCLMAALFLLLLAALACTYLRRCSTKFAVVVHVIGWFAVSMSITFTNKHLLTDRHFEFPFSVSCATNSFVFFLVFSATRIPSLKPPTLPWSTLLRVVLPIGILTAADIGCSNWALVHLSVAFHTIVRGTVPAFVLCFSLLLGLDRPSWLIAASVGTVVLGCGLAAYAEIACDLFGLSLALLSCVFSGLRWALTQVLVHAAFERDQRPAGGSERGGGSRGGASALGADGRTLRAGGVRSPRMSSHEEATARALDRNASPLSSMYYVTPACAVTSGVAAFFVERTAVAAAPHLSPRHPGMRSELIFFVGATGALVFVLLFCEFGLVRLTSSLSLSVFGVLKELITIVLANQARGDPLTPTNVTGFMLCSAGILLYQMARARMRSVEAAQIKQQQQQPQQQQQQQQGRAQEEDDEGSSQLGAYVRGSGHCEGAATTPHGRSHVGLPMRLSADDGDDGDDAEDGDDASGTSQQPRASNHPSASWATSGFWGTLFSRRRTDDGKAADDATDVEGSVRASEMGLLMPRSADAPS